MCTGAARYCKEMRAIVMTRGGLGVWQTSLEDVNHTEVAGAEREAGRAEKKKERRKKEKQTNETNTRSKKKTVSPSYLAHISLPCFLIYFPDSVRSEASTSCDTAAAPTTQTPPLRPFRRRPPLPTHPARRRPTQPAGFPSCDGDFLFVKVPIEAEKAGQFKDRIEGLMR